MTGIADFTLWGIGSSAAYWSSRGGTGIFSDFTEDDTLIISKCVMSWDYPGDVPSSTRDIMQCVTHWIGSSGDPQTWTDLDDTDYATVEGALDDWWRAIRGDFSSALEAVDFKWYKDGPGAPPPQLVVRTTPYGVAGTDGGNALPRQIAEDVTFRTASRRHWGRAYVPGETGAAMSSVGTAQGRFDHTFVDLMATAWSGNLTGLDSSGGGPLCQCVWGPMSQTAFGIGTYETDDVPDVQRRRRPASTGYRKLVSS
jgi:hypothetical protein